MAEFCVLSLVGAIANVQGSWMDQNWMYIQSKQLKRYPHSHDKDLGHVLAIASLAVPLLYGRSEEDVVAALSVSMGAILAISALLTVLGRGERYSDVIGVSCH